MPNAVNANEVKPWWELVAGCELRLLVSAYVGARKVQQTAKQADHRVASSRARTPLLTQDLKTKIVCFIHFKPRLNTPCGGAASWHFRARCSPFPCTASQLMEAAQEALAAEERSKEQLCQELNLLVQQSAHAQLDKLEQLTQRWVHCS